MGHIVQESAIISGFQPTLPLPPLSALYGLLTAAKGDWVTPHDAAIGFVFKSNGKAVDLETVYEFGGKLVANQTSTDANFLCNRNSISIRQKYG